MLRKKYEPLSNVVTRIGGGLASSAYEWLLQRLAAVIAQRGIASIGLARCLRRWHLLSGVGKYVFNLQKAFLKSSCTWSSEEELEELLLIHRKNTFL